LADVPTGVAITPPAGTLLQELRPLTAALGAAEAGLLAYARALSICGAAVTTTVGYAAR
jgi:hypothetical protein